MKRSDAMARTLDNLEGLGLGIKTYLPSRRRPPMKRGDAVARSLETAFGSRIRMGPSWQPAASALANAPDTAAIAVGSARRRGKAQHLITQSVVGPVSASRD